jgi:hypothetical protein
LPGLVLAPVRAGLGRPETRMPLVAFTTFAILKAPPGDPAVQGFFDRLPETFGAADAFEGFVARSTRDPVTLRHSWGDPVQPRFYDPARHAGVVFTLSLWRSLEPVNAFAYSGVHGEALRHRLEWFLEPEWPSYAAWWVDDGHVPDWHEASGSSICTITERARRPSAFARLSDRTARRSRSTAQRWSPSPVARRHAAPT